MNRQAALCLVLAFGLIPLACSKQEAVSTGADSATLYTLVSVDGKEVPASVSHGGVALQVVSGTFSIRPDGTCASRTLFVPPGRKEIAREVEATYTQDDSVLTMKWEGAGMTVGTVDGDTFTMDNEGMVFVYRK